MLIQKKISISGIDWTTEHQGKKRELHLGRHMSVCAQKMKRAAKKNAWCFLHWDAALEKNCLYSGFLIRPQYSEHVRFTVQFSSHSKHGASICGSLSLNVWRHTHVMIIWLHTHWLPTFWKAPSATTNFAVRKTVAGFAVRAVRTSGWISGLPIKIAHDSWFHVASTSWILRKIPSKNPHWHPIKSLPNRCLWECGNVMGCNSGFMQCN